MGWTDAEAHTCNCSYWGRGDEEDCISKPAPAKSSQDPNSTNKKLGARVRACHPSYMRSVNRKTAVQSGHESKTIFKK
jgi:hypothetical protein